MVGRSEQPPLAGQRPGRRSAGVEQAEPRLDPQDARDGIVDPRHRDHPLARGVGQAGDHVFPAVGRHHHVDAGQHRLWTRRIGAPFDLAMRIPVGDDEPAKAHAILQHPGQKAGVAGHLAALPA